MKEVDIQRHILQYLKIRGVFVWRCNNGGVFDPKFGGFRRKGYGSMDGVSDIIGMFNERFLAIEVKAGKNKPTEAQEYFLKKVKDGGGIAFVAYSLSDVDKHLGWTPMRQSLSPLTQSP